MVTLDDKINKIKNLDFEIDLGFSFQTFLSSYRKRFHNANYFILNITLKLDDLEELNIFEDFYVNQIKYGKDNFEADLNFGFGTREYSFIEEPVINNIENDIYEINIKLIQKNLVVESICKNINICLDNLLLNLAGNNLYTSANVLADTNLTSTLLCLVNLNNIIENDINEYVEYKVLTSSILN